MVDIVRDSRILYVYSIDSNRHSLFVTVHFKASFSLRRSVKKRITIVLTLFSQIFVQENALGKGTQRTRPALELFGIKNAFLIEKRTMIRKLYINKMDERMNCY